MNSPQTQQFEINIEYEKRINYAFFQNKVPFIHSIRVRNISNERIENLELRIAAEPAALDPFSSLYSSLDSGQEIKVENPGITFSPKYLKELNERESGIIKVELFGGETSLHRKNYEFEIFAFNEWCGVSSIPEILAAFCTPNQKSVASIIQASRPHLQSLTGEDSFSGYQKNSKEYAYSICHAIYYEISRRSIGYINPPASFENTGQKVRFPDEIEEHPIATCLDLTLLFCACLEQIGLHPLIILIEGHSFVGVHLEDSPYSECIIEEPARLRNRIDAGDMIAFETTGVTHSGSPLPFERSCEIGRRKLDDNGAFLFALDVRAARNRQIRPLSVSMKAIAGNESEAVIQPVLEPRLEPGELPTPIRKTPDQKEAAPSQNREPVDVPARIKKWKEKLLDLTMRNRLLNFKESKKTVSLWKTNLHDLEDALAAGAGFELFPVDSVPFQHDGRDAQSAISESGSDPVDEYISNEMKRGNLHTMLSADALDKNLIEMSREYKNSIQEGGANTLFLAMGFLSWFESDSSKDPKLAPIILLPLEITRKSIRSPFKISLIDEEPRINVTLLKKLENDFGILVDDLDPLPLDDSGLDLKTIFNTIRKAIEHQGRWEVLENASIGHFSFSKYLLWNELENHLDMMMENPIIKHIIDPNLGQYQDGIPYPDHNEIDEKYTPKDVYCVTDADSSQMAAIVAAAEGKSFVLQGPPGTGKSQTITNIIAHCIARGKRVLFVSAKMAALNVVHDRLGKAGLGAFCLELHSNKNSVRHMLDQCKEALDVRGGGQQAEEEWKTHADSLQQVRDDLNEHATLLRSPQPFEKKTFQVFAKAIGFSGYPKITPELKNPEAIDAEFYEQTALKVDKMTSAARSLKSITEISWKKCYLSEWDFEIERSVQDLSERIKRISHEIQSVLRECSSQFMIPDSGLSAGQVGAIASATSILLESKHVHSTMLHDSQWEQSRQEFSRLVEIGKERDEIRSEVRQYLSDAIFELDVKPICDMLTKAEQSGFFGRMWHHWKATSALKQYIASKSKPKRQEWIATLERVMSVQEKNRNLSDIQLNIQNPAAKELELHEANWDRIADSVDVATGYIQALNSFQSDDFDLNLKRKERWLQLAGEAKDQVQASTPVGTNLKCLVEQYEKLNQCLEKVSALLSIDLNELKDQSGDIGFLEHISALCESWLAEIESLRDWALFNKACEDVTAAGFGELVHQLRSGELKLDEVLNVYNHSFYRWSAEYLFEKEQRIKNFQSAQHLRKIQRFQESDQQLQHKTKQFISEKLSMNIPNMNNVHGDSEPGKLMKYIGQQRPRVSIRKLIRESGQMLPRIKPCFLMSPLSIAQYLDFDFPPFDLVLFDEASQLPVWDAVSALARAKQAIVVGDSKQLPPTTFFARSNTDDELFDDDEIIEQESLLDEFEVNFPREKLKVHYRSRHEDLITFSNRKYYNNELITFPSSHAQHPTMGVSLRYLDDAVYDRGGSRTNRREADAVVQEIIDRLSDPEKRKYSIGVVTLNSTQQRLIEDLLDKARRDHPKIDEFFSDDCHEPVIVKNIENVQGDERDIIMLSITYGPGAQGQFYQSFGPIAQSGGERRLNVAVTRARRQLIVFSSILSDRIAAGGARGREDLKAYLDYAERGPAAIAAESIGGDNEETESVFEQHVLECLQQKGWKVHTQVGCSGYRIDLAVVHPEYEGRYLLGIECDGAMYHSSRVARERDRIREYVLRNLGWDLHRIWSTDWWLNPKRELERLESHLNGNLSKPIEERTVEEEPEVSGSEEKENSGPDESNETSPGALAIANVIADEAAKPKVFKGQREYKEYQVRGSQTSDFYDERTQYEICSIIKSILDVEGPVEIERLIKLVRSEWGMARTGSKVKNVILKCVRSINLTIIRDRDSEYVYPHISDPNQKKGFRVPGDSCEYKRSIQQIPTHEIENAAEAILQENLSLPLDSLVSEVIGVFGIQRANQASKNEVEKIIKKKADSFNWTISDEIISL